MVALPIQVLDHYALENEPSRTEFPRNPRCRILPLGTMSSEVVRRVGAAAALRCSRSGRLLIECIHPVSAPPYGRRELRRGSAKSTKDGEHRFRGPDPLRASAKGSLLGGSTHNEHLVDPQTVHVYDLETPAEPFHDLSSHR